MRTLLLLLFFTFSITGHSQRADFASINFYKADQLAIHFKGKELRSLPLLVHNMTSTLPTDVERFRAIYYWVTHNIKGDQDLADLNTKMRERYAHHPQKLEQWNHQFKKKVFQKLITKKQTLCTGYAYLIKTLASFAGIECVIIQGRDTSGALKKKFSTINHTWNAVKLQGKWYLCDATWSSGYTDMATLLFEFDYDDSYFLMDPQAFYITHKPVQQQWALLTPAQSASLK